MADTYTANYNLVKIEQGSTGWASKANGNMDTIDGVVSLKIGYDAFNNVGIGTLTPSTKLHVVSSINQGILLSDGTTIGIMFPSSTLTNSLAIGTQSNHPLIFGTNNVFPRMMIDTLGNVGIGTSTPSSTLHIKQNFSGDLGIIFEGNTKIWGFLNKTDGSFSLKDFITDTDRDLIDVVSGDRSFHKVNGSEIMRIANSGNVGIGTTSPGEKLEVNGAVKIGTASGTADGTVRWTGTDFEGRKGGAWVSLTNTGSGTVNTGTSGYFAYYPSTGTTVDDSSVLYTSGTNVGVGVTSLTEKLEIAGAIKIGTAAGTADGTIRWTGTDFEGRKGGAWASLTSGGSSYWGRTSPYVFPTTTSDGICLGKTVDGSELAKIDITTAGSSDAYIFRHVPGSGNGLLLAYDYSASTYQLGDSGSFSFEIGVINSWTLSNGIRVDANHLHCTGIGLQVDFITAPTSASATGIAGEIRWDTSYIYICTATNTWKKVAIATW